MMGIAESTEVLRAYLDESAACVPPRSTEPYPRQWS